MVCILHILSNSSYITQLYGHLLCLTACSKNTNVYFLINLVCTVIYMCLLELFHPVWLTNIIFNWDQHFIKYKSIVSRYNDCIWFPQFVGNTAPCCSVQGTEIQSVALTAGVLGFYPNVSWLRRTIFPKPFSKEYIHKSWACMFLFDNIWCTSSQSNTGLNSISPILDDVIINEWKLGLSRYLKYLKTRFSLHNNNINAISMEYLQIKNNCDVISQTHL